MSNSINEIQKYLRINEIKLNKDTGTSINLSEKHDLIISTTKSISLYDHEKDEVIQIGYSGIADTTNSSENTLLNIISTSNGTYVVDSYDVKLVQYGVTKASWTSKVFLNNDDFAYKADIIRLIDSRYLILKFNEKIWIYDIKYYKTIIQTNGTEIYNIIEKNGNYNLLYIDWDFTVKSCDFTDGKETIVGQDAYALYENYYESNGQKVKYTF